MSLQTHYLDEQVKEWCYLFVLLILILFSRLNLAVNQVDNYTIRINTVQ